MKRILYLIGVMLLVQACNFSIEIPFDERNKFTGWYDMEEYSQTTNETYFYRVRIRKSDAFRDEVIIKNFYAADIWVYGYVVGNKLFIDRQVVDGYEIEGVGTWQRGDIDFTYSVRDLQSNPVFTDFCNARAFK